MKQIIILFISVLVGFSPLPVSKPISPVPKPITAIKPVESLKTVALEQVVEIAEAPVAEPTQPAITGTCADWMKEAGVTDMENAYFIIMHESGCDPNNVNPSSGACGIPQSLPCSKLGTNDPVEQIRWMQDYVNARYGGWANAVAFWNVHYWY